MAHYGNAANNFNYDFLPCIIDVGGRMHSKFKDLLFSDTVLGKSMVSQQLDNNMEHRAKILITNKATSKGPSPSNK